MENFHGTPENHEKHKSLAQQIFSHLWYVVSEICTQVHG